MAKIKKDINYALVEDSRPPLYTAMKYWGKNLIIFGMNTYQIIHPKTVCI